MKKLLGKKRSFKEMINHEGQMRNNTRTNTRKKISTFDADMENKYFKPNDIEKRLKNIEGKENFKILEDDVDQLNSVLRKSK